MPDIPDEASQPLPQTVALFPLAGVLLLPRTHLPLHVFEPRYRALVQDVMAGDRLLGIVQPLQADDPAFEPDLCTAGCLGRINEYEEIADGRSLITVTGLCRFDLAHEIDHTTPYRQAVVSYERFRGDLAPPTETLDSDLRRRVLDQARRYLSRFDRPAEWSTIEQVADAVLIDVLATACPFGAREKQALLEAISLTERAQLLAAILEMSVAAPAGDEDGAVH